MRTIIWVRTKNRNARRMKALLLQLLWLTLILITGQFLPLNFFSDCSSSLIFLFANFLMLVPDGYVSGMSVFLRKSITSGLRTTLIFGISYFLFSNPIPQYFLYLSAAYFDYFCFLTGLPLSDSWIHFHRWILLC